MKDYYKTLNIDKGASKEDIKKAYKKLARKYHPDLNPNNKTAEAKFKEVSEAYEVLSDDTKRAQYERGEFDYSTGQGYGQGYGQGQGPYYYHIQNADSSRYKDIFREAFGGFDFEELFREASNQRSQRGGSRARSGEDILYNMEIDFNDSILGAERQLSLPQGKNIQVKIPPGIKSGQKLRFASLGQPGQNGGQAGDMYLEITVKPSDTYTRVGNNLEVELPISFATAILGGTAKVLTPHGYVTVNIPKGINAGTKLEIKGKGILTKDQPGDLLAKIIITIPPQVSPQLEEAIREWKKSEGVQ